MSCQVKSSNVWEHGAIQRFTVGVGAVIPPPQVPWFNKGILHERIESLCTCSSFGKWNRSQRFAMVR